MKQTVTKTTLVTLSKSEVAEVLAKYLTNSLSMDVKSAELYFNCEQDNLMCWDLEEVVYRKEEKL